LAGTTLSWIHTADGILGARRTYSLLQPEYKPRVATASIQELTAKIVPFFEVIEGRTYIHNGHELKAEEVALPLLYHAYPGRVAYDELVKAVKRHGIAQSSAYAGISKLKNFVDANDDGWVLRGGGRQKAEVLLAELKSKTTTTSQSE